MFCLLWNIEHTGAGSLSGNEIHRNERESFQTQREIVINPVKLLFIRGSDLFANELRSRGLLVYVQLFILFKAAAGILG